MQWQTLNGGSFRTIIISNEICADDIHWGIFGVNIQNTSTSVSLLMVLKHASLNKGIRVFFEFLFQKNKTVCQINK
ncbi:hypothetical protein BpHYR1_000150 [Brachionus plicatilis]|uniref:Uncharacterized protein n=1 Tax=Brachionus plicatilis TaxID=10195 RepID=A0A3M7SD81_BRAPC|nr:hypothetical protein BpHYR1_000150 [Brachionus plicatilis]